MKGKDDIPLVPTKHLHAIKRDRKTHRALTALAGRVAAQVCRDSPADLLLWVYLTGVAHGAETVRIERESREG